ncbi:response regulator transcription factor [Paenibacillus radicis (ex Xue et al. 2023)]|uniref:Response regulator n=1 Tax=Paenibacillus radicis (ex Xue et al. 2023) TaxID=2972489 RepID=A0ABT1YHZ8_9BACL|nr:response regulator [Paenibacillus radicis (ex Xue et al. 2023)]MCR8632808.1 response regulator [Paenibacillus radicis (ex Xue et al. 2023)]
MKVLIADDEEHVREGIELAIDWDKFGITERLTAEDGQQALELIRLHNPAVLFCDMSMPNMEGTELLRLLREEGWSTQVIVVSGYDAFSYTQAAIRANGVDYLLKPFSKSDLEHALIRAVTAWQQKESSLCENRETEYRIRKADALLDEQKLASYFIGETALHEGIRSLFFKIGLPMEQLRVALVLPRNRMGLIERRFFGDGELFVFAVNNITHETLKLYNSHYLCRLDGYQWLLITAAEGSIRLTSGEHRRCMDKIKEAWRNTLGLEVLIGLCDTEASVETLPSAVGAARTALLKCNLLNPGSRVVSGKEAPRLTAQQILLQSALKNENKAYVADIIRSFTQALRERGELSLKELQSYTMEANLLLEQAGRLHKSDNEEVDAFMPQWISDLDEWEKQLVQMFWMLIEEEGNGNAGNRGIQAIYDYIHRHFQEELSLSMLSERFRFSPQYIAKKFKELYNTTLMTYLTELRMEKAKSLLLHTDMPVSTMAGSLGYTDDNYFSKVFKKQTGVSPLQYRKQRRDS